jgi:thiol-disulfide isomerase/thioredoxin
MREKQNQAFRSSFATSPRLDFRIFLCAGIALWSLAAPRVALCNGQDNAKAAMQVLQRTAATYKNLESYEFKVVVHFSQGAAVSEQHLTESGARGAKYTIDEEDPHGNLRISDGQTVWTLSRASNTYVKVPVTPANLTPISDFENIAQHVAGADIMREERYIADGKPVLVYVVAVVRNPWPPDTLPGVQMMMYRIDEETFAVHEVTTHTRNGINQTKIVVYSDAKWNRSVQDADFTFSPPPSAQVVSSISASSAQVASLIGAQAPDFTLEDANGKSVSLRDFRGKVVIVDFWASWCGPCRAQMPYLQDLHQKLADKGLVVLGLDIGEDSETVTEFARQGAYTFTLLLGGEPDVDTSYYVGAFPTTLVIDRQGKIIYRDEGFGEPNKLRSAVVAALK